VSAICGTSWTVSSLAASSLEVGGTVSAICGTSWTVSSLADGVVVDSEPF
jgi:hypothetical protein